jgi:hypothetical protein
MLLLCGSAWALVGLLGLFWAPPFHSSWSRSARLVLWLIGGLMLAVLGPFGLYRAVSLDRAERWSRR